MPPALGTILFVVFVGPGPVIGLVPWLLSGWTLSPPLGGWEWTRAIGAALFAAGLPVLVDSLVRFVREGRGTPTPIAPTERLVVSGLYRHLRNPMYVAVASMVAGQGLFLGSRPVLIYAGCLAAAFHAFVRLYEERALRRRFGSDYEAYCRAVMRWWPRWSPWRSAGSWRGETPVSPDEIPPSVPAALQ